MRGRIGLVGGGALMVAALAACSGPSGGPPPPPGSAGSTAENMTDRVGSFLFGATRAPTPATPANPASLSASDCPSLDVRQGASTFIVYDKGEQGPTNVRYQASVGQTARECLFGATITMKVGMQGRVILGPKGAPGRLDLPIRFALVQEGPEPKTLWTRLYKTAVDVPPGETNVPFMHVEDNLTFPNPGATALEAYVVYVGFDNVPAKNRPGAAPPIPGVDPGPPPPDKPRTRGRRGRRGAATN